MSGLNAGHVGIAGEVRCIVKREDGSVKEDTGFQKNLILNQGLDFFGGNNGDSVFERCVIGSGNIPPVATDTKLGIFLAITTGTESSVKYDYIPSADNLYKSNKVYKYTFTELRNVNVSEVGLVSQGTTSANYYLCTRALLKDASGAPTTITILSGETLEVYYKIWRVISTLDVEYVANMLDGKGGSMPYNTVVRPIVVGTDSWSYIGNSIKIATEVHSSDKELSGITTKPISASGGTNTLGAYIPGSYKVVLNLFFNTTQANKNIRCVTFDGYLTRTFAFYPVQVRFGSVVGDNPIPKTSLQTLVVPIEISWGRYEGVL